ncbi:MAG: hypothetical protein MUC56_11305 [Thermoanaerobaculales bacterium]|nr:hypothetical protein [Thermoanaerobaculales bacterium]
MSTDAPGRTARVVTTLVGVLLAAATTVRADRPTLELEAVPASARLGDRVRVLATARGGEDLLWGELAVGVEPDGPWEIVSPPTAVAGARPPVWELVLAPMRLGELPLPPITVTARGADGATADAGCETPPVVTVVSTLAPDEESPAPAPLRDPIGVRGVPWEWILPAALLLLPVVAAGAWWWRARLRPAASERPPLAPLPELEATLAELDGRIGRDPADGVCDRLAAALRRYLERRTGEPAAEMTSFELRLLARRRGWPETSQRLVQQIMGVADGVRFSRRPAAEEELRRAVRMAGEAARSVEAFFEPAAGDERAVGGDG